MKKLSVEYVRPETLKAAPYNPREIGADALKRLAKLLDRHGFVDPVIARRSDGLVIGGHQRLKANALRTTPDKEVPVIFLEDVSDHQAKALNIALNNPRVQGHFDRPKLAQLLEQLSKAEVAVPAVTGFPQYEIAQMLEALPELQHPQAPLELRESFQVVVEVESEQQQRHLYEQMIREGFKCRLLTL